MNFNSINFLIFYTVIVFLYFCISSKHRWILLLIASYYFYACWNIQYTLLMLLSTFVTYISGLVIQNEKYKKKAVFMSFFINLTILFFFKYFNFFNNNLKSIFSIFGGDYSISNLNILLPVGISFYTFQALSYTMDVYRGDIKPEKNFGKYALFVSYFPQLVAGPIERSTNLLPQLQKETRFEYENLKSGLLLILVGFFKKVVVADRAALLVNNVYSNLDNVPSISVVIAAIFFSIQIYCDFSAYSDIARGASRVLGIELMKNFDTPYYSKSIGEFWRRWHISLGTWFREYLYIPLGGSRVTSIKKYRNILIVFSISGLWHGASWNFIIWGALHGFYQIIEGISYSKKLRFYEVLKINKRIQNIINTTITFTLVTFSWIFFRAENLQQSKIIIFKILSIFSKFEIGNFNFRMSLADLIILALGVTILEIYHLYSNKSVEFNKLPNYVRYIFYYISVLGTLLLGKYGHSEFIYFQF